MTSTITKAEYEEIYRMLDTVSPLDYDCGELCGAACCAGACAPVSDPDDEVGIFLLPGEDALFTKAEPWLGWGTLDASDYEFPESWDGEVYFLSCKANCHCDRSKRPLQCRSFPLAPHFDSDGRLRLIFDCNELPYKCPLIHQRAKYELNSFWVETTYEAWARLIRDPLIRDLVQLDSDNRIEDGIDLTIVK